MTKQIQLYLLLMLAGLPFITLLVAMYQFFFSINSQQFSLLATSFLQGKLSITPLYASGMDTVFFNGTYYWPLGPFPAVILMPFVGLASILGLPFYEFHLHIFLFLVIWLLWYCIAKKLKYSTQDALFWAYAFCFCSPLFGSGATPTSWHFAQLTTVFLSCLILYEYLTHKRLLLLGLLMGLIAATRLTAGLGVVFFVLTILTEKSSTSTRFRKLGHLLAPFVLILSILLLYNWARFGNTLEQGYGLQQLFNPALEQARNYGIFHLIHLPGNLYYFLLAAPEALFMDQVSHVLRFPYLIPNPWGMGLLYTSPYYIYLFFLNYRDKLSKLLWLTVICIATPIFFYYGIGYSQYGYRYALDFLPFLFFLLIRNYQQQFGHLSLRLRVLIILGCIWNMFLVSVMTEAVYIPMLPRLP